MSVSFQVQVDSDKEQITKIWFAGIWKEVIMTEKRGKTRKRKENKMYERSRTIERSLKRSYYLSHGGITPSTTQWLMLTMFERCLHFPFPEFNESNDSPLLHLPLRAIPSQRGNILILNFNLVRR